MVVSSALQDAQARLHALRAQSKRANPRLDSANSSQWTLGSRPFASVADPIRQDEQCLQTTFSLEIIEDKAEIVHDSPKQSLPAKTLIHGELAAAVLREGYVGAARIWWLLRGMDGEGKGFFEKDEVKQQLVGHIGGWRRIRQLLCEGDGLFWRWDGERIWLRSVAKIAAKLGIVRFSADPIPFPTKQLFGRISQLKANLYAIFHSSRDETPIARETLQDVTGISASCQRNYEQRVGICTKAQYALLPEDLTEMAWQHGHAIFAFTDHLGKHGKPGQRWTARQLPNCYSTPFNQRTHKRSRRRLNRKLADLLNQGTTGNDWQTYETVYYAKGARKNGNGYFRGDSTVWFGQWTTADQ